MKDNLKAVAIVNPNPDTFSNPTLVALITRLSALGIHIVLFCRENHTQTSPDFSYVDIQPMPPFYSRLSFRPAIRKQTLSAYGKAELYLEKYHVQAIIGVDPVGFIVASRLKRDPGCLLGYFSFEIFFRNEVLDHKRFRVVNKAEKKQLRKNLDFFVIQDRTRLKMFLDEHGLQEKAFKHIYKIPVAPEKIQVQQRKDLHKMLGVPAGKKLVVHSGYVGKWTGIDQLLYMLQHKWDNRFWLVIHTRVKLDDNNEYKKQIDNLASSGYPVLLHNEPFESYETYCRFLAGFDIGLALYVPDTGAGPHLGKNIANIGLASGKFATYMMLGIPTLTSNDTTYAQLNKEFDFGYVAVSPDKIPTGLDEIDRNYNKKSEQASYLFDELLDPSKSMSPMIGYINSQFP